MDAQYYHDYPINYMMIPRKEEPLPLFPPRTTISRPSSEATEIFEDEDDCYYESPMQSVASLGAGSLSTVSTPDNVVTPESTGLTAFDFHIDDKHTRGPSGPHLFRTSMVSDHKSAMEVDLILQETPVSATGTFHHRASKIDPIRRDTPVPNHAVEQTQSQYHANAERASAVHGAAVLDWSPGEVVHWMRSLGYEDDIIQKFYYNDISGSILLELQPEDLKELEILSFGKRHRLMNSIQSLRKSVSLSSTAASSSRNSSISNSMPSTTRTSTNLSTNSYQNSYQTCSTTDEDSSSGRPRRRRQLSDSHVETKEDIKPGDSVSIVAIEQLLPKTHKCSKGEACRKWQKQQAKLARMADDLPIESLGGRAIVTGDPGNPKTAPNLLKSPRSEITPSLTASSDAMGYNQSSAFQLSQEKLKAIQPRDPQENVRNFLNFQSLDRLQTVNEPCSPPRELLSSPEYGSPDSAKVTPTLAENLRHLPRLQIPSMHNSDSSAFSGGLRTVTPSVLSRPGQFMSNDRTAVPGKEQASLRETAMSPGDYYRLDPYYRQETPFSDTDAPVTALPIGPVAREESQSVPPNMRFGNERFVMPDPLIRSASTKAETQRHYLSTQTITTLNPLKEGQALRPIETPEDLQRPPRAPTCRNKSIVPSSQREHDSVTHCGWMKKRKTTRLLRHEWQDHHFTLKGTQLAMHNDEESAHRNSKALEYIDVDDYAVACSSLASSSKLTAAFKKTVLKRRGNMTEESAFAFSLIPAPNNGGGLIDRKALLLNSGKSHHFAVKSRDERIEWMREVMLAKTTKRALQAGDTVNINGSNMI